MFKKFTNLMTIIINNYFNLMINLEITGKRNMDKLFIVKSSSRS